MEKKIQNEINREIRAFNKTITPSTTNKEIWNKKVELSNQYGLKIIGKYENEKQNKYKMIGTVKKGENALYIIVEPKAIEIEEAEIEFVEIPIFVNKNNH